MYTPVNPQFYYIIVGFKGVNIVLVCFRDDVRSANRSSTHHNKTHIVTNFVELNDDLKPNHKMGQDACAHCEVLDQPVHLHCRHYV